ncbi:hypothetical protein QTP88_010423 [Uroleucon formosanum]
MSNSVHNLINIKFSSLSLEQKLTIKNDGRPLPELKDLKTQYKKGKNEYFRNFNTTLYLKNKWLCGCEIKQALFCFPCLLFGGETAWTKIGVTDLQHLNSRIVKHENSFKHIHNATNLNLLGKVDIRHQIDIGYKIGIQRHNELVDKNRYVLDKILNCIKCCGKHELPLRGHDEKTSSKNQGVFRGILDLCIDLDSSLRDHFEKSTVFRGSSKTIQNYLLDSILSVCRNKIVNEIQQSEFISIIVDETTDISNIFQLVLILRYEVQDRPVERFWGFENPNGHNAEALSQTIFGLIDPLLEKSHNRWPYTSGCFNEFGLWRIKSLEERFIATLRFLATGRSYEDLKFSTGIAAQTLGSIIPETCKAIYEILQDTYMKVKIMLYLLYKI